jgi:hypothetical protein
MSTTTPTAVAEYVAGIEKALADLPAAEVEEIVEDIGQHLSEVAGELGEEVSIEALTARLGPPEQYASELRAAAGYPPPASAPAATRGTFAARVAVWGLASGGLAAVVAGGSAGAMKPDDTFGLVVLLTLPLLAGIALIARGTAPMSTIRSLPEYRAVTRTWRRTMDALPPQAAAYVRSLRPAWWLIRVLVLASAVLVAMQRGEGGGALLLLAGLAVLLLFGKRARADERWRWVIGPANVFTVAAGLALILTLSKGMDSGYGSGYVSDDSSSGGLYNVDRYVENVYAFGPDGKPLPEVYLYDQDGQPISLEEARCDYTSEMNNRFPHARVEADGAGCREVTGVPFTVAIPQSSSATSTPSAPPSTTPPPTTIATPPPSK